MTLSGVMAIILRYFAEFGSFRGQLRKVVDSHQHISPEKCHKVHQLSTIDGRAVLFAVAELLVSGCSGIVKCHNPVLLLLYRL